ncbi:ABC transporter ATP-binding protein [Nocardioides sp. L-11A]|uniref:ABC transporter ATP-binding protein n=1 Tax=Nocardioides sp. L-11A TaxID=3043848 RepID=UPI00249AF75B|nr:ABC transporter ATP-binding protein [Nocardioides sp. L-11A]
MTVVEVDALSVDYLPRRRNGTVVHALSEVSVRVEMGQTLGVVGESGSGKSTLGRVIAGLEPVTSGRVVVAGREVHRFGRVTPREFWRDVQMVWQDPLTSLTPHATIGFALEEALRFGTAERGPRPERTAAALLEMVELSPHLLARYPHELSGGQRQRVAIARAMAPGPQVIVLDEAVSALDVLTQMQILDLLTRLQGELGVALVFISHDLGVVEHMASRMLVLYRGHALECGDTATIAREPSHPYTRELFRSVLSVGARRDLDRSVPAVAPVVTTTGCPYAPRCERRVAACEEAVPGDVEIAPGHRSRCLLVTPLHPVAPPAGSGGSLRCG